jgi:sulfoxide reductase catalytic subunit YedY
MIKQREKTMKYKSTRRQFITRTLGWLTTSGIMGSPLISGLRAGLAKTRRTILPKGTKRESLINKNPKFVDTRNLEIIPLKEFETMGLSNHALDINQWRLEVTGEVKTSLSLTYSQITALPAVERNVLLICPGVFVNHGSWRGVSILTLLRMAKMHKGVTHVTLRGPAGPYENLQRFPMVDIYSNTVFLAYQVNGQTLPQKHGFPLRTVAEDYYGDDWIKYVYKVNADRL